MQEMSGNTYSAQPKNTTAFVIGSLLIIVILLTSVVLTVYYMRQKLYLTTNAQYTGSTRVSLSDSYVFASPVRAKAGGDLIRVTAFILDENGHGIGDKQVEIVNDNNSIDIKNAQNVTDDVGKAFFDLSANIPITAVLNIEVDGYLLNQSIKVKFD